MNTRPIPIRLEHALIARIDGAAKILGIKRSSIIKLAISVQLPQLEAGHLNIRPRTEVQP
jgi:hypothetical protein